MWKFILLAAVCLAASVSAAPIRVVAWDERAPDAMPVCTNSIGNHFAECLKTFPGKCASGEAFRTGMLWSVGRGKVFCPRPERGTFPGDFNPNVLKVIGNPVEWMGRQNP